MFKKKKNNFINKEEDKLKNNLRDDFVVDLRDLNNNRLANLEKKAKVSQKKTEFSYSREFLNFKYLNKSSLNKIKKIFQIPLRFLGLIFWLIFSLFKFLADVYLIILGKKRYNHLNLFIKFKKFTFIKKIKKIYFLQKKLFIEKIKLVKKLIFKKKSNKTKNKWPDKELKNVHKSIYLKETKNSKSSPEFNNYQKPIYKKLFNFLLVVICLLVPFQLLNYFKVIDLSSLEAKILDNSENALVNLKSASDSAKELDISRASVYFSQAGEDFSQAKVEVEKIDKVLLSLASLSNNPKIKLASQSEKILKAGNLASKLGEKISLAFSAILDFGSEDETGFSSALEDFSKFAKEASQISISLENTLEEINSKALPENYNLQLKNIQLASLTLSKGLKELSTLSDNLQPFLGVEKNKRYLLIFQNNNELRASGGFMGSFALADIKKGKIINLEVPKGGTYDTEAGLLDKIESPEPLWLVNPRWYFWDSNWFPDWKKSARNIAWFYEKSDGPSVDGVISFTPTVLEKLLEVIGPVYLEEYDLEITADNFWDLVQVIVEEKSMIIEEGDEISEVQNTQPKKIIGDLMFKIIEEMPKRLNSQRIFTLLQTFDSLLTQKQILFYFNDKKLQEVVEDNNWAGRIKETTGDYLSVINTNIAGQKTDRLISQTIDHSSQIQSDGSIINTVRIYRQHQGIKRQEFTGVRNVNWLRVYVPLDSEFISAEGFSQPDSSYFDYPEEDWLKLDILKNEREAKTDSLSLSKIYNEDGKTVLANWTMLDPGENQTLVFKYKLPFNFYDFITPPTWQNKLKEMFKGQSTKLLDYSLLIQKQAGDLYTSFSTELTLPKNNFLNLWHYPDNKDYDSNNGWQYNGNLQSDKYFNSLWQIL